MIWTAATGAQTPVTTTRTVAEAMADGVKWQLPEQPVALARRAAHGLRVVLAKSVEEWSEGA